MKIILPGVDMIFEAGKGYVNEIVIENQKMFMEVLADISRQIDGGEGTFVLSENEKILQPEKRSELLASFVSFSINKRALVNKLVAEMEKHAVCEDDYEKTTEMLSDIERYLNNISFGLPGDIVFNKVTVAAIVKSVNPGFREEYENLAEKLLDYFELVTSYENEKVFFLVNLRSFVSDEDMELLLEETITRGYKVFLIESSEREKIQCIRRYIVDKDLCEISC